MAVIIIRGRGVNVSKDNRSLVEPKVTAAIADRQPTISVTAGDKLEKREPASALQNAN